MKWHGGIDVAPMCGCSFSAKSRAPGFSTFRRREAFLIEIRYSADNTGMAMKMGLGIRMGMGYGYRLTDPAKR